MYVIESTDMGTLYNYVSHSCRKVLLDDINEHADNPSLEISALTNAMRRCDTHIQQLGEMLRLIAERGLCEQLAERFSE